MRRANPLVAETLTGLGRIGAAQRCYFHYLLLQAVVVFLSWPKATIAGQLASESGPLTLLATLLAVSVTLCYYSLRAGAEELLLPGQYSLWEWTLATPLKPARLLRGYLASQTLQALYALMLSSPLLLMSFAVAAGEWLGLALCLIAVLLQASCYRLLGAVMAMTIVHREKTLFFTLRGALLLGYLAAGILWPASSIWQTASQLLADGPWQHTSTGSFTVNGLTLSGPEIFFLLHSALCILLAVVLYRLIVSHRAAVSSASPDGHAK